MGQRRIAAAVVAVAAVLAAAAPGEASIVTKPAQPATTTVVRVAMFEFGFTLSRKTVPRGKVIFLVRNRGKVEHDFEILGTARKTPVFLGSQVVPLRVDFERAGTYRIQCTVPGHIDAGMWGYLTVR